jgi:hypothetical protein
MVAPVRLQTVPVMALLARNLARLRSRRLASAMVGSGSRSPIPASPTLEP